MRFVFVHGGFHAAWCWDRTIAELESLGHRGVAVDLPGHGARIDRGVEDVSEILRQLGEVRCGHIERERCDSGRRQFVPVCRVLQPSRTPYLVSLRECARDRKGDLAGRAGDQDLLSVEHPLVIAHRHPNVKYLICWACAVAVR